VDRLWITMPTKYNGVGSEIDNVHLSLSIAPSNRS
jgi:hypothetical protein